MKFLTICALVATANAGEIAVNTIIKEPSDTCATPAVNVPCKGANNKYYCVVNTATSATGAIGATGTSVNAIYTGGLTCKTVLDGQLKVTDNTCKTGSYPCTTIGTVVTVCVTNTSPFNQKNAAFSTIAATPATFVRTPNVTGGCFGIADGEVIDIGKGQVCSSSSDTAATRPCTVSDPAVVSSTKIVCVKYASATTAAALALTQIDSGGGANSWKSPNVLGGCWGIADGAVIDTTKNEVCSDATGGSTGVARACTVNNVGGTLSAKICVKYTLAAAKTAKTAIGMGAKSDYLTPNANGGCWNVADNAVIDSTKNEVCNTGSVECLLKDPTANSNLTSKQCVASTNAKAKATSGVTGGSVFPTYVTPAVENGCFNSPDYAVYKTNLICNTGSVKCALRNKTTVTTVINACVPFSAAAAVTGYEYLTTTLSTMSTVNNYLALAKTGGCFGVAKYEPTLVGGKEQGICQDTGFSSCRMVKPDGTRAGMCVPTVSSIRGALVGATAAVAATGKDYYYPASGCFTVDDYATIATGQSCLRFGSKTCKVSSTATPAVVASICVPPSFAGKKQAVPSGAAAASTAPDVTGGCWGVANWKAAGMFDTCTTAGSLKCALTKTSSLDKTFCVPKTFTDKAKAVDVTKEPFKTELATDANGYSSPAGGCFPSSGSGAAQLLAGAAAATTAFLALY